MISTVLFFLLVSHEIFNFFKLFISKIYLNFFLHIKQVDLSDPKKPPDIQLLLDIIFLLVCYHLCLKIYNVV